MATLTAVPVSEYLRTAYDPDMEYVGGQLVERHVGEYFQSLLQILLGSTLNAGARERHYRVFSEQRVRVSDEPRYRIPDLCVKALPHKITPVLTAPDLVIEILSPDDKASDTLVKIADYVQAGIPYIWIVDPYKRTLLEVARDGVLRPAGPRLSTPLTGEVDFTELFQQLDEPAE
jgi:Uma2 family endonuclease